MAKRTPEVEEPYNPLDPMLAQSVIRGPRFADDARKTAEGGEGQGNEVTRHGGAATASKDRIVQMPNPTGLPNQNSASEPRCREKRVVLSRSEERQIERLVDRLADELRTSLKLSHLLRAAVSVLLHAEEELIRRLQGAGTLERPSNWDAVAIARFEHDLARILSQALRDAPPLR